MGLSDRQYCILDVIYQTQVHPDYKVGDWAKIGAGTLGRFFGCSRQAMLMQFEKLSELGFLEIHDSGDGRKKTTPKWYREAYKKVKPQGARKLATEGQENLPGEWQENLPLVGQENLPQRKKEKKEEKGKVKPAPDFSFENTKDAVLKYLNKAYKKTDLLSLVEGTNQTVPELLEEVAAHWAGDGRTFDPNLYGDQKGLDTSLKNFAANNQEKEVDAETKFERVSDRVEQIIDTFKKYSARILSERAKAASEEMIRRLLKKGETLEDFDRAFSKIKNGKSEWRDLEKALKDYETLKSIASDAA